MHTARATLATLFFMLIAWPAMVAAQVVLTPQEQAWVRAHPVLTMALDQFNPPIAFRRADSEGSYAGACFDYAELVARKTGLKFRYEGSTWDQALTKGMAHAVDGVLCARDRPERRSRLNFSQPYLELPIAMVTRPDHAATRVLGDYAHQRVAVTRNSVRVPVLKARCPDCVLVEVDSSQEGMARVQRGEADACFDDLPVVQRAIGEGGASLKIALLYYYSEAATIRLALRNDAPLLLSIIDKGVAAITADEHARIRSRWLAAADGTPVQRELTLTPAQHAWLAAHPVLRVAVDSSRAPIEWRGEDGQLRGISLDFLRRVEEQLGVRFELLPVRDVADEVSRIEQRQVDLVSAISHTPGRAGFMLVTEPYLSTPVVIFAGTATAPMGGLGGLAGQRVAVAARTGVADVLPHDWPAIAMVPVSNFRAGTELLRNGKVHAIIGPLLTGTHQLVELGATDVRVAGETDYRYHIGIGVRSDWAELVPILNAALAAIPRNEREAFRQNWSTVHYAHDIDYRPLGALALAVLVAITFIVQLRVMVKRRTAELQQEVAARRSREAEIQELNAVLEQRVLARTAELRQANDDLRLAAEQLVQTEKVASLGRLVAGIAHELSTPLGSALTASTTLKAHVDSFGSALAAGQLKRSAADTFVSHCQQATEIIERNTFRAAGLIDNFKELAVDQASVRRRVFPLRRTVEEVIASHHNSWKHRGHHIALDVAPDIELDSFPGPLAQVLSNLLENSLVHGFEGRKGGRVHISARRQDERVLLTYEDDGKGIPPEYRSKIYDPFFTTRLGQGGSGLGLYIVQTLVTGVLGGTITLQGEAGAGTLFQISLPLKAPQLTERNASGAHGMVALPDANGTATEQTPV
ncbi:transporter substrate-binding domain-containing protein [Rugamonas apoptosis]|uniref:histidine kinase n=1 Tax=Rugamonas apoptosis TaxID=2758570 RepID=A0A7W2IMX0_9BURK|nr:transporter substrate-binding domain-containing protein [Rugamonas apoptosis]MBA5690210.1 transporter substrate-binding domain-containing protein [Rugamonas apoptosis]